MLILWVLNYFPSHLHLQSILTLLTSLFTLLQSAFAYKTSLPSQPIMFLLGFCSSFPYLPMVMLIYIDLLFQPFGDRLDLPTYQGFPDSSVGKESTCNAGDPGSIPRLGRSAGEGISYPLQYSWATLVAQLVKNPPTMQETWVWSLGWKDPLEKGKAIHSSIQVWRIPCTV